MLHVYCIIDKDLIFVANIGDSSEFDKVITDHFHSEYSKLPDAIPQDQMDWKAKYCMIPVSSIEPFEVRNETVIKRGDINAMVKDQPQE